MFTQTEYIIMWRTVTTASAWSAVITAIGLPILITIITGLWFTWGGVRDIRALFRSLKTYQIDDSDNGTVKDHQPF